MVHILLHFLVPLALGLLAYRERWRAAAVVMIATMAVDLDHLLADPVYDPERCSIGFHPLHTAPAIAVYLVLVAVPIIVARGRPRGPGWWAHLVGVGLIVHMALDGLDCLV